MSVQKYDISIRANGKPIVEIDSFKFPENKITFLFGESGIGKTMISRAIYGLLDPRELAVTINGYDYHNYLQLEETKKLRQNSFFVFQDPSTHLNPLLTIRSQLREGSLTNTYTEPEIFESLWTGRRRQDVDRLLNVYPKPHRPSGGEKQRLLITMAFKKLALLTEKKRTPGETFFVFDEPTGSLDNELRNLFLDKLFTFFEQVRFTGLLITHDYSMISRVLQEYGDLLPDILFLELRRKGSGLTVEKFVPETYLDWIASREKHTKQQASKTKEKSKRLLKVNSGVEVFERRLKIHRGSRDGEETALEINSGELAYLKAPSGEGKTTLVKIIMGLQRAGNLQIELPGHSLTSKTGRHYWQKHLWGKRMTMVFQSADEALNQRSTVRQVFEGLPVKGSLTDTDLLHRIEELFETEMDPSFLHKPVSALSGGQKQRINLLRALLLDTGLLFLDEPLTGLDFVSMKKLLERIEAKQAEGAGLLMVSHNEEIFDAVIPREHRYYLSSEPL